MSFPVFKAAIKGKLQELGAYVGKISHIKTVTFSYDLVLSNCVLCLSFLNIYSCIRNVEEKNY